MNHKLLLFLFYIVSIPLFSQEFMVYKGSKPYPATSSWDFICENYALTGITKVQIAKTDKGGTLKLALETTNPQFAIAGIVYVYLLDNTILVCTDKGIRESIGNQIVSYYSFSNVEMNKLKKTDIQSIRFNIKGNQTEFSSQTGNFTAINRKAYFATTFDKTKKSFDTAPIITLLYK